MLFWTPLPRILVLDCRAPEWNPTWHRLVSCFFWGGSSSSSESSRAFRFRLVPVCCRTLISSSSARETTNKDCCDSEQKSRQPRRFCRSLSIYWINPKQFRIFRASSSWLKTPAIFFWGWVLKGADRRSHSSALHYPPHHPLSPVRIEIWWIKGSSLGQDLEVRAERSRARM